MELTWIQRHALMVLLRNHTARVKELTPQDIAGNMFAYHLDGLVAGRVIEKSARGTYRLTAKGQKIAGKFSTLTEKQSEEIKTVVMLYGKKGEKYLLFRWSRQPYLGKVTLLYDRIPFGKTLADGISFALEDKLGFESQLTYRTSALVQIVHQGLHISHMNSLIYEVDLTNFEQPFAGRNGEAFLGTLENEYIMQGIDKLIHHIENRSAPSDLTLEY